MARLCTGDAVFRFRKRALDLPVLSDAGRSLFAVRGALSSGAREAQSIFSGLFALRARVERVADMSDGHVDEIEQRSVRTSFPESSGLSQFSGDVDQAIDFRHRSVPLMMSAAAAPVFFPISPIIPRTPIKPLQTTR